MALVDFVLYKGKPHFLKVYRPVDVLDQKLDEACGDRDLGEIGGHGPIPSERLREVGSRLNKEVSECLAEDTEGRAKKLRTLETEQLPRLERYERQLDIAGDRGSYSKTDHDATFMGMKEDPMRNHQLKASCNVQMGTEGQFIVGFSVHQASTDTALLIPHLDNLQETLGRLPSVIVADAGYGSEENYGYLEGKGIPAYVKYSTFHQEKRRAWRRDPFRKENFPYDVERDTYTCPCGDELRFEAERNAKTRTGHVQTKRIYRASHCPSCPYRKHCAGGEACRSIQVNRRLDCFRDQARGFRRFLTRGLAKVRTEWGLFSLAHNILKVCTVRAACRAQGRRNRSAHLFFPVPDSPSFAFSPRQPLQQREKRAVPELLRDSSSCFMTKNGRPCRPFLTAAAQGAGLPARLKVGGSWTRVLLESGW